MVGSGLLLRVEARIRNELWRRICVDSITGLGIIDIFSRTFSKLNFTECRSQDTEPNDTSTSEVLIAKVDYSSYNLEPTKVQHAADCSEFIGLTSVNVYCYRK